MTLSERAYKLHELAQDFEKLGSIVESMKVNEDAPFWNSDWACELMTMYNQVTSHAESLRNQLGL